MNRGAAAEAECLHCAQGMVGDFHAKFGRALPETPVAAPVEVELQSGLLMEEATETCDAANAGDMVGTVDGLVDTIYIALGWARRLGVDLSPLFAEVHGTNMAKEGGSMRADGKILKPPGWQPPRIADLLRAQGWKP